MCFKEFNAVRCLPSRTSAERLRIFARKSSKARSGDAHRSPVLGRPGRPGSSRRPAWLHGECQATQGSTARPCLQRKTKTPVSPRPQDFACYFSLCSGCSCLLSSTWGGNGRGKSEFTFSFGQAIRWLNSVLFNGQYDIILL